MIAYVTNREAVHQNTRGQSVWLLDPATGNERALLSENGASFAVHAWLGRELVFSGRSGVSAIDVATGARRELATGTFVATSPDGNSIVSADDVPHATALRLLTGTVETSIPAPPAGSNYAAQAVFSPNGERLLLHAVGASGRERRFFVFQPRDRSNHGRGHGCAPRGRLAAVVE